jgi:hypothetical protein
MHLLIEERKAMADTAKTETPITPEQFHTSKTGEKDRIDRSAELAAEKAGKTEKRYDKSHDIFTK